jgi:hypothetical protein
MPALCEEDVVKVSYYNSLTVEEYNGKYYLRAVSNGKDDNFYLEWVFLSKWSQGEGGFVPGDRKMPMGVLLGESKDQAIASLETILVKLKGNRVDVPCNPQVPDDDIPF